MVSFLDVKDDFENADFTLTDETGQVRRNEYASNRRGSLSADPADDDDIRAELSALSYQEFLMRHELLEAITVFNGVGGIPAEERQEGEEHNTIGQGRADPATVECTSEHDSASTINSQLQDQNGTANNDDDKKEPPQQPWYKRLLDRPPTLEQEIKRKTEELKLHMSLIERGFEDVMDCQTETQQELIKRSIDEHNRENMGNKKEESEKHDDQKNDKAKPRASWRLSISSPIGVGKNKDADKENKNDEEKEEEKTPTEDED